MLSKQGVMDVLTAYLKEFEAEDHNDLIEFLNNNESVFDRRNFNGHITASAFIADSEKKEILLLKHKLYDRYLQAGGHVEKGDRSILKAALREASEETGIAKEKLINLKHALFNEIPLDIDSHFIPANKKKDEPEHVHHDFRYLFFYNGDKNITIPHGEAKDAKWVPLGDLAEMEIFSTATKKIKKLLGVL
jgi:8-oxo-dGTP pyrophosphatase MutT (NUDIX family)